MISLRDPLFQMLSMQTTLHKAAHPKCLENMKNILQPGFNHLNVDFGCSVCQLVTTYDIFSCIQFSISVFQIAG